MDDKIRFPFCPNCKASFAMTEDLLDSYERSGKRFYCPQGHGLVITQNDIVSQLRSSQRALVRSEEHIAKLYKESKKLRKRLRK